MPVAALTRSGRHWAATRRMVSTPSTCGPGLIRSSANSVCTTANNSAASVPGTIGSHSSARAAVCVRTGSITITLPRRRIPSISPITFGAANSDPCDAAGLAPMMTSRSVRSISGTGKFHHRPYIRCDDRFLGHWSTVPGEYVTGMPDIPINTPA